MQGKTLTNVSPWVRLDSVLLLAVHFCGESVVLCRQAGLPLRDAPCLDADENGNGDGNREDEETNAQQGEAPHGG
jgi:hypothetical protein